MLLKDFNYHFGYANHPSLKNETTVFEYETHDKADLAKFKRFNDLNERTLENIGQTKCYQVVVNDTSIRDNLICFFFGILVYSFVGSFSLSSSGLLIFLLAIGVTCMIITKNSHAKVPAGNFEFNNGGFMSLNLATLPSPY